MIISVGSFYLPSLKTITIGNYSFYNSYEFTVSSTIENGINWYDLYELTTIKIGDYGFYKGFNFTMSSVILNGWFTSPS